MPTAPKAKIPAALSERIRYFIADGCNDKVGFKCYKPVDMEHLWEIRTMLSDNLDDTLVGYVY